MGSLPEIPRGWLIAFTLAALVIMRFFSIDSWTTAALSSVIGFLLGKHLEQTKAVTAVFTPQNVQNCPTINDNVSDKANT